MEEMHPQYFGYDGEINANASSKTKSFSYDVHGKIERTADDTLLISELPIRKWTQDYKVMLEKMMIGEAKKGKKNESKEPEIKDFKENHTDTTVSFTIIASKESIDAFEKEKGGLLHKFQLSTKISTSNMNVFDQQGRIVKFDNALEIIDHFYEERLKYYTKRKDYLLANMRREEKMLSNKARFIEEVCAGDLVVNNRKRAEILAELKSRGYELFPKQNDKANKRDSDDSDTEEEDDNASDAEVAKGYEYLLGMKIWSLTFEKAEKIRKELAEKTKAVKDLEATEPTSIWEADLDAIEEALDERDEFYVQAAKDELEAQNKNGKRKGKGSTKGRKRAPAKAKAPPKRKQAETKSATTTQTTLTDFTVKATTTTTEKAAPAKATTAKAAPKKKAPNRKAKVLEIDSDSETEESMTLMDRMQKMSGKSKPLAAKSTAKARQPKKKRETAKSQYEEIELDAFDAREYEPAALTPAPKKKKSGSTTEINLETDDEIESVESDDSSAKSKSRPAAKKTTRKKKLFDDYDFSESEDEDFDEDVLELDDSPVKITSQPSRARSGRAKKKVTYVDSDSDFEFDG